jgi:hypothetical protein
MNTTISFNGKQRVDRRSLSSISTVSFYCPFRSFPYVIPLMNTLQLCSIYYTVAVSFDRFLYLSYGLQAETICTVRNSLRVITVISICSILFILPHWFKHRVVSIGNNRVQLKCQSATFVFLPLCAHVSMFAGFDRSCNEQ